VGDQEPVPSESAEDLVDLLNRLRLHARLTSGQLANRASISPSYASEILNGRKTPRPDVAAKVAEALHADEATVALARKLAERAHQHRMARQRSAGGGARSHRGQPSLVDATPELDLSDAAIDLILAASARHRMRLEAREVDHATPRSDVIRAVLTALDLPGPTGFTDLPRVVPVRGAPGAGKTVIAGQLFDALAERLDAAVLIVPCEQVLVTPSDPQGFDAIFGELLDSTGGLVASVRALTARHRRVIVLFDTVDCVLDEHTRVAFVALMTQVHDSGAEIVFTCRRHDLNVLLQPSRRLGALAPVTAPPIDVPPLTGDEVIEVTVGYLTAHGLEPEGGRREFAQQVLNLAANRTPLFDIVVNPLLLVMLCQLFAGTGIVPPDLTTTRLCLDYCRERVAASRKYPDDTELAEAKHRLWQSMAGRLWRASGQRLSLTAARTDLLTDAPARRAFDDLCSEGVLVPRSADEGRVGFLHQVIAEYSIAIHLRDNAPEDLAVLLDGLRRDPSARWYAWQIVRHLIALADATEVENVLEQLDLTQFPAYRAAAFGAAAEWRPGVLLRLAERPAAVEDLCEALLSVPDEAVGEALRSLAMAGRSRPGELSVVIMTAGALMARAAVTNADEAVDLLSLLREVQTGQLATAVDHPWVVDTLIEQLLGPATARGLVLPSDVLAAARVLVPRATPIGVRAVIRAHLVPGSPPSAVSQLRDQVLRHRRANGIRDGGLELIAAAPPWVTVDGEAAVDDLLGFLADGARTGEQLRAAAVAQAADRHPSVRRGLVEALALGTEGHLAQRLLICLQEAVKGGGVGWVTEALTARPVPTQSASLGRVCGLLKACTSQEAAVRHHLADWFVAALAAGESGALDAYLRLVRDDEDRLQGALPYVLDLTEVVQQRLIANLVRELSGTEIRVMRAILTHIEQGGITTAGAFRARLVAKAAETDPTAREELVKLVTDTSELAAAQAIFHLQKAARERRPWLVPAALVGFASCDRASSRLGALQTTAILVRNGVADVDDVIVKWLSAAHMRHVAGMPDRPAEATARLELAHSYLRDCGGADGAVLDAIRQLVVDLTAPMPDDIAVRKAIFALVKTALVHGDRSFRSAMGAMSLDLFDTVDLAATGDGRAFAPEIMGRLVEDDQIQLADLVRGARTWYPANLVVLVGVVLRHDRRGPSSPLLDEILSWQPPDEVKRAVWTSRT